MFDEASLARQLQEAGYTDMQRYDWRTTEHAQVDDFAQAYIPHKDRAHGTLISLNMEARKARN